MPKLPRIKPSEVIYVLQRLGFVQVRQRGSHVILKKQFVQEDEEQKIIEVGCVVPLHNKTVAVGTLKSILNQAGVSVEEFLENL
ncbi:type II toxin-antitoxin system HicA family toxin [Sphaerospermopsis aphanizomenoides BCCUSP55]|uniref:type II toxin-antitoxin system HicA family toxin n=1 Tax=Sphaerospermopsis aphanizomenoides TaxID=459663 RepID=UPI000A985F9F|nr:type II toxin-antitoxin system HicA family toxin [Sphaerospermopsis aphanizomenoides]MBK1986444.1 type II toxin-antitoxin system HicA family toxin [Sphaerospermopsis aphanizomenoides BCCUSP55]